MLGNNPQEAAEDEPEEAVRTQADVELLRGKVACMMSELEAYSQPEAASA